MSHSYTETKLNVLQCPYYMVPWTFSLDSAHGLADFVEYHAVFLPKTHLQAGYDHLDEHEVESLRKPGLLSLAREVGRDVWAARQALKTFIEGEGASREWEWILRTVRPSTAVLLARVSANQPTPSLDRVLAQPEAAFAFHEQEEEEIRLLRPEVWVKLWSDHAVALETSRKAFEKEQAFFQERLAEERVALSERGDSIAEERLAFLQELEDRVFLRGERVGIDAMEGMSA